MIRTRSNDMIKFEWFKNPIQVKFFNADIENWSNGIAYMNEIISGIDGKVFSLQDIYSEERLSIYPFPIKLLDNWIDFSQYLNFKN